MTTKRNTQAKKKTARKPQRNIGKTAEHTETPNLDDDDEDLVGSETLDNDEKLDEDLDEEELLDEEGEGSEEEEEDEPVMPPAKKKANAVVVVEASTKLVPCRGMENHRCSIGGNTYRIEKNKDIKLPSDVATILQNSGKVMKK